MAESFGQRLRYYRELAGLTQAQLAAQVGISRSALSRMELDIKVPRGRPTLVAAIAVRLGVTIESLMPPEPEQSQDTLSMLSEHWTLLDDESRHAIESTARAVINLHRREAGLPPI